MSDAEEDEIIGRMVRERRTLQRRIAMIRQACADEAVLYLKVGSALQAQPENAWFDPPGSFIGSGECFRNDWIHFDKLADLTEELRSVLTRLADIERTLKTAGI